MGRKYSVPFDGVSISAAQDLWEIQPADDKPVKVLGWTFSNVGGTADAGDAAEELLRVIVSRGGIGLGSGGTSVTGVPLNRNDAAAGFTAKANNTTIGTSTASTTIFPTGLNVRTPDLFLLPEEMQPTASQADITICVRLQTAPADAVLMSGALFIEEL